MPKVIWSRASREDLRRIDRWLSENASAHLAYETLLKIREKAKLLEAFPAAGPVLRGTVHKLGVRGTSYMIMYRLGAHGAEVVRIRHEREDWKPAS